MYTYTCTRAHPQRTSSRGKACVGLGRQAVGSWPAECAVAVGLTRRLLREDRHAEVGEEVRVGPVKFKL